MLGMEILHVARVAGLVGLVAGAGMLSAAPASAGGIGVIASPAFNNTCVTIDRTNRAVTETAHAAGLLNNAAQLPLSAPYQHCGGADIPAEEDLLNVIEVAVGVG
ncbi:hypothetical protein [Streptomyces sp. XY006]|uniref:hypothetical protein n=1 Tax=Streptomyces sp. XY006 TaxID=2021410 RepID=UPI00117DB588|nr:hypothetical protein [Streptomyces sp. XY006]